MGNRRKAREFAIKVLFHMEFNPGVPEETFKLIVENFGVDPSIQSFAEELVLGVYENKKKLDDVIRKSSKNWKLERMSRADRSILRLGAFEILFRQDIPPKVSIDEAVELGKRYGTDDSSAFINGILDNIYNFQVKRDSNLNHGRNDQQDLLKEKQ
jgi:transcription antitermination factor NusB